MSITKCSHTASCFLCSKRTCMNKSVTDFFLRIDSKELNYCVMCMNIIFKALHKYCRLLFKIVFIIHSE